VLTDRFYTGNDNPPQCNLETYCGGTWAGIADKLDYITSMGFDAIWISPIVVNAPNGYHGYWATNIDEVNPYFGSSQDLLNLVQAAHAKGVWVMVDVVGNHMSTGDYSGFVPFNNAAHYHDCNTCDSNCDISDWNNQPQVEHCRLAGLNDLNQTNPYVANTLCQWISGLVSTYGFDGIRIDTIPEVERDFWGTFVASAGVYAVGEVDNGNPQYVGGYQGAVDGTLSYPMFFTLRSVFASGQSMNNIQSMLQQMGTYFSDQSLLGNFVDNHDNPRFLNENGDHALYKSALLYSMYSEGIPIVYYGSEQGFNGGNDPNCREPMWTSGFSESTDLYTFIQQIVGFRKTAQIWNYPQVQRYSDDSFYAFTRGTVFVALTNTGSNGALIQRTITYQPYADGTKICNLFYPTTDCIVINNGQFTVYLQSGQCKIYSPAVSQA